MPGMPGTVTDERSNLLAFVTQQAYTLRLSTWGLTDEQARSRPTVSALSMGGILKHVTLVVRGVTRSITGDVGDPGDWMAAFVMTDDDTLGDLVADLDRAVGELVTAAADEPLDRELPVDPGPWMPDVATLPLRHRLAHMVDEIARHNGHADIVRESLDGVDAGSLMAGYEQWPPNPYVTPYVAASA